MSGSRKRCGRTGTQSAIDLRWIAGLSSLTPNPPLQFFEHTVEFGGQVGEAAAAHDFRDLPVIPEDGRRIRLEAGPHPVSECVMIPQDAPQVVQLVRRGHAQHGPRFGRQVSDMLLLPLPPGRLRFRQRIAASADDLGDGFPERGFDLREHGLAALVLGGVVQQRGDDLGFRTPVFTVAATDSRCDTYGMSVPFLRCVRCSRSATRSADPSRSSLSRSRKACLILVLLSCMVEPVREGLRSRYRDPIGLSSPLAVSGISSASAPPLGASACETIRWTLSRRP